MKKILNLTQHQATAEQKEQGVYDLSEVKQKTLKELLTFEKLPTTSDIYIRVSSIAELAYEDLAHNSDVCNVMIGGALWLMKPLIETLTEKGLRPLFAFSEREVIEESQPDGSVKKTSVFKHNGFVPAVDDEEILEKMRKQLEYYKKWKKEIESTPEPEDWLEAEELSSEHYGCCQQVGLYEEKIKKLGYSV